MAAGYLGGSRFRQALDTAVEFYVEIETRRDENGRHRETFLPDQLGRQIDCRRFDFRHVD